MSENIRTYQTRISQTFDTQLSEFAALMSRVEHCLFADIAKGNQPQALKSSYLTRFGITARHFNAIRIKLEGKIDSIQQRSLQLIEQKKQQIQALEENLSRIRDKKILHAKRRRLATLRHQLSLLEKAKEQKKVSLCFGSKKRFHAVFHLAENGYSTHEEWKQEWQQARTNEIFLIGSQEETSGNQSCTATLAEDESIHLRIRLPDALNKDKYLLIPNVRFAYGHQAIVSAIRDCQLRRNLSLLKNPSYHSHGRPITFRFKRDHKGWRLFASVAVVAPQPITRENQGVIGVDINGDHLAIVETDRFGNPIEKHTIPLALQGKTKTQARALIADASKKVITLSEATRKPLIIENLDFQKKKAALREQDNKTARRLSAFAYQAIHQHLKSRAVSKGVQVYSVNPAYTSLIGRVNYAKRYGLSIHHAAALCIGRRSLGLSEKMPSGQREIPDGKGDHVTLALPERNRARHVWSQWRQFSKKCSAALTAHFRTKNRSSSSRKATL